MSTQLFVVLRGSGTPADARRTTDALNAHTSEAVLRSLEVVRLPDADVWDRLAGVPDADVVLLETGVAVGPGWHERLRAAAYEDAVVATASAVPAEILAVGGSRVLQAETSTGAALGEPLWGCVYVRRDALNVALAARANAATRPRLEEVLLLPGLVHVLAGAVVQRPRDSQRSADGPFATPAVRRTLTNLEAHVEPLRVTVDLRCCAYPLSGTQVHALNLVAALANTQDLRLSVLLPEQVDGSVRPHVDALPAAVKRLRADDKEVPPPQVFHRPYQLFAEEEITRVLSAGSRLVMTHQDMILDRTPAYFPSKTDWRGYTAATALSFVAADEVAFFSEHARNEAIRDGLVDPAKTSVVPPGTNHVASSGAELRPARLADVLSSDRQSFILVLSHSYFHKNRLFALRLFEELQRNHLWEGALVFAGGRPPDGSSVTEEEAFVARHPELRARFVDLARVRDDEQRWLYRHAALALYPTLYEGFGLVPFEAAAAGTPCVYSSRSSVAEFLPVEGALLDVTDVAATARRLSALLEDTAARDAIVRAIQAAGKELTWERAAALYAGVYRRALERPVGLALTAGGEVIVGARSQLAADDTERRLLLASRHFAPFRLLAKGTFASMIGLVRLVRRP